MPSRSDFSQRPPAGIAAIQTRIEDRLGPAQDVSGRGREVRRWSIAGQLAGLDRPRCMDAPRVYAAHSMESVSLRSTPFCRSSRTRWCSAEGNVDPNTFSRAKKWDGPLQPPPQVHLTPGRLLPRTTEPRMGLKAPSDDLVRQTDFPDTYLPLPADCTTRNDFPGRFAQDGGDKVASITLTVPRRIFSRVRVDQRPRLGFRVDPVRNPADPERTKRTGPSWVAPPPAASHGSPAQPGASGTS